ncbi:MAG: N-formylglutamate amidohydrolase [Gammaproteobacteria bacterium]|nr:N-formylglutamate amidohydrolase [Gammaproteobacteria bacterium]
MPADGENNKRGADILKSDEPAPYRVLNPESTLPILLICDHASRRFPAALGTLGIDPAARRCHLAWDIGAGALTEKLAASLGATAVMQRYSRLAVDCNRQLLDPGAFLEFGDGMVIAGNRNLRDADKEARANAIYWPYHAAISQQVDRLQAAGHPPAFLSIHSFTPVLNGISRHWEMGILWDKDSSIARPMIEELRAAGYDVGDNEPYSGKAPQDFTIDHHAESTGIPHVGIEIRQDLIDDDAGVGEIADVLHRFMITLPSRLYATDIRTGKPQVPA